MILTTHISSAGLANSAVWGGWSHLPCRVAVRGRRDHRCTRNSQLQARAWARFLSLPSPASLRTPPPAHFPEALSSWEVTLVTMWVTWKGARHFLLPLPQRWQSLDPAQLLVSQPRLRYLWLRPIPGAGVMGWSLPAKPLPFGGTLLLGCAGCRPHTSITHFPPKVPAIPNGQCDFILS